MKAFFSLLIVCFTSNAICQTTDTLIVSKLADLEWTKKYSNSTRFAHVKFEDGTVLKVGDKMRLGVPSGSNQSADVSVGLGGSTKNSRQTFTFIMLGRMGAAVMGGITYLPDTYKGRELTIENIKLYKSNKKDRPSIGSLIFQNPGMDVSVLDLKSAMEFKELINLKARMTSDEALAQLKRAKDKLDLGLITQVKFDSLRTELSKYID